MIAVVTAVLTGSAAGLIAVIAAGHSAVAGFVVGGVVGAAVLAALMWHQYRGWEQGVRTRLFGDEYGPTWASRAIFACRVRLSTPPCRPRCPSPHLPVCTSDSPFPSGVISTELGPAIMVA